MEAGGPEAKPRSSTPRGLSSPAFKCTGRLCGARSGSQEARDPEAVIQAEGKLGLKFPAPVIASCRGLPGLDS